MLPGRVFSNRNFKKIKHLTFSLFLLLCCNLAFSKTYDYNLNGDIKYISSPNGKKIQVEYDGIGRASKITYSDGKEVTYEYDHNDNRIRMTDFHGITIYEYDALNRLKSITYPGILPLIYEYNPSNQITYMKYPNGEEVFYDYNSEGRLKTVQGKDGTTTFSYDNSSNTLSKIILPNGTTTKYEYDLSKRVIDVIHKDYRGRLLLSYHYDYDANDNYYFMEEKSEKETRTVKYNYDKLNRLILVNYSDGSFEKYTYDAFGNRKTKETQQGIEIYEYDSNNLLRQKGDTKFFYDEAGNLRRKEKGDHFIEYTYDENDLLIQVKSPDHTVNYEYDGDGKRISNTIDGIQTYYINDAVFPISQVLLVADENKQVTASYTYAERRLSYMSNNMQSYFYLYDHPARNVTAIIRKRDNSLFCYVYDSFGNSLEHPHNISNPFQYAGEQKDEETGLIYLRNRYYDPELGRFITPDHHRGDFLKPQSWNPYVYVQNNPVNLVDPLGLDWITAVAYPPGTMTNEGRSLTGHAFIVLKRENGTDVPLGKYPTFNPFKPRILPIDRIYPGSQTYTWEISPEVYNAIATNFGKDGFYLLAKNNCCDAALQVIQKYVDPTFGSNKVLGVNNPTSFVEALSEKNGQKCDYINRLNEIKKNLWEHYENDAIAPTSNGFQYFWNHFLGISDRGGVSLNKTADLVVNLSDIMGATFDEQSGQLILIGKRNYSLPHFNSDDFAVAVRSVFGLGNSSPSDPGISMDPYPLHKPKQMNVRYDGETINTEFGRIMFDADRLLKCLSLGKDNLTNKEIKVHVPDYKSLPERYEKTRHPPKDDTYTRLWFMPEEIRVVQSAEHASMQFENVKMKVLAEAIRKNKKVSNPAAEDFAGHITNHYEKYADEFPILNELKRLGQITGIVKWIKDNHVPFDLSFFKQYQPKYVATPTQTKLTVVSWGNARQHCVFGGVSYLLNESNFFQKKIEGIEKIKDSALQNRPNDNQFIWDFNDNGSSYLAVAQTLYRTPKAGNVKKGFIDMSFPVEGDNPLALIRIYNSFEDRISGFGTGWEITPAELRFPDEKKMLTGSSHAISAYLSILVKDEGMEQLYTAIRLDAEGLPIYSTPNRSYILKANKEGGFALLKRNIGVFFFDNKGKLRRIMDKNDIYIDYIYEGSNLMKIAHQSGKEIRLKYSQGRIHQAEGLGGKVVNYYYDDRHQLKSVINESKEVFTFFYDDENRLDTIKNSHGKVIFSAQYDVYGRAELLEEDSSLFQQQFNFGEKRTQTTNSQQVVTTKFFNESLRLKEIEDSLERSMKISYKPHSFLPESIKDSLGYETQYEYDTLGNLVSIQRPDKSKKQFWYDSQGHLIVTKDGNGLYTVNNYDERGRIIFRAFPCNVSFNADVGFTYSYFLEYVTTYEYQDIDSRPHIITYPGGKRDVLTYNENGQISSTLFADGYCLKRDYNDRHYLKKIYDDSGFYIEYDYNQDFIRSLTTPSSQVTFEKKNNALIYTDGKGHQTFFVYDEWDRLTQIIDAEGGITTYKYDELNQLEKIIFPNGSDREFDYNKLHQPIEEKLVLQVPEPDFRTYMIAA